jgi:TPR repeat protein
MNIKSGCPVAIFVLIAGLAFVGCTGLQQAPDRRDELLSQAEQGDSQAQYQLAKTYCCGLGMRTSTRKSLYWHCRAAIQGYAPAQFEMGNILSNFFDDTERTTAFGGTDYVSAYMWYTIASINGHEQAFDVREKLAKQMSSDDVIRGKRWATQWKQIHCDNLQ